MTASPFTKLVAGQVRAEMARARISGVQLAEKIGRSHPYMSRRLTGTVAFDTDDLAAIGAALGIAIHELMPTAERAA